ncbi:hypothetical protein N7468_006101 [Penicillium chermesinum]|uniref:Glycosyl hydrolase family 92 domain-containing protein n=1 Tax=Penicillium chermesinum TaxID=63820 RepID=A0A9W9P134_9EURO|nr:uncharacterized protein N7468_006101 [Penicillium chermesinum]KAJ5233145.1 hypothetical protein N7468_006101 [Penicillium chermesinum]
MVEVRTGISYVSVEQARRNLDFEISDDTKFEHTVEDVKEAWLEKLGRITVEGVNQTDSDHSPRTIFYTGLFHALQYPSDFSEPVSKNGVARTFYSGYTDQVHTSNDSYFQSWSIWDTYRAEHALLTLLAPEKVNNMMRTLLQIFDWSGWLPMWANMVETNIMIATNADVLIANALERGFRDFDLQKAWAAVKKDAYTPPDHDTETLYYDREPNTSYEVRAGLTAYKDIGWVPNDGWSESGSRTLDYAFDDFACSIVASHAGADAKSISALRDRSYNYRHLWNNDTKFMQARNRNGTWANNTWGWTEGDDWVAWANYNATSSGLSGNDDLGQMSAWYVFSALGFYPVNPASDEYIVGSPFFEKIAIRLPAAATNGGRPTHKPDRTLVITAPGAPEKPYIKSLKVDGRRVDTPILKHSAIVGASHIAFEMSRSPTAWGTSV